MKPKTTLVLLLAVLGLGWYVLHVDKPPEPKGADAPLFPGLKEEAIASFSLLRKGSTLTFERAQGKDGDGKGWALSAPLSAPADDAEAQSLLRGILSVRCVQEITEGSAAGFGLDAPELSIRIQGKGVDRTLKIGRETPWSGGRYATVERADGAAAPAPIVSIEDALVLSSTRPLEAYRKRNVVDLSPEPFRSFHASSGGRGIEAVREAQGWIATKPDAFLAGDEEVREWMSGLSALKAETFVDDAPTEAKLAELGLSGSPFFEATFTPADGGKPPVVLRIGKPAASDAIQGSTRYFQVSPHPFVYAARVKEEGLLPAAESLRADSYLQLSGTGRKVNEIRIDRKEGPLALRKEGDGWVFTHEGDLPTRAADALKVAEWLLDFQDLRFREFAKGERERDKAFSPVLALDEAARKRLGLGEGATVVSLAHAGGTERLRIGTARDGRCAVQREGESIALWAPAKLAERARARLLDLRDRRMTDLWADGAYSLEVRFRDGRRLSFRKDDAGRWLPAGAKDAKDRPKARDVARKLARLEAERIFEAGPTDWAAYGLSAPEAAATACYASSNPDYGDQSCTLRIGAARDDGSRHARVDEDRFSHLFTIPKALADEILQELPKEAAE